jgi:hypothetical protein
MDSPIPANGTKRVRPGRRLSIRQVVDLQGFSFEAAKGLSADFQETKDVELRARIAAGIANLSKGWCSLQDAKREVLGKPKAGVRKYEVERKPGRKGLADIRDLVLEPVPCQPESDQPAG